MSENEKKQLFDDSDTDEDVNSKLQINKSYAQRYDEWREAEIKRKLEDRYGNVDDQLSSSSSDDDDDPQVLEKALSKDFFEVISQLRKKDPKIYNPEIRFFNEEDKPTTSQGEKKKDKPVYLRDYERKLIVERGGVLSEDESDTEVQKRPASPSLAEKERSLKESLSKIVHSESDDSDDGGLLIKKVKTADEKKKEGEDYLEWLRGRKEELKDKSLQESLSHLKEEWSNPNLDDGEKFLRDYILNKRYLGGGDDDVDTGDITDDDLQDEYMDEFERKYNFRFEEPDSEFLKRYPRTIDSSMRKKDDRRKRHREEVKKRKEEEKLRQREELKVLKSLKRKEILKKIEKLKEITGNAELGISDKDLEEDYDPEEHDRRMNELFNEDYYKEGDDEMGLEELPLPPLEDDLVDDYENWDEYEGGEEAEEPHCEDPDFNMDCDFDPEAAVRAKEAQPKSSRERRKLKRQSRFGTLVRKKKPEFDPNEKSFQQYVDEYYGIDYEDIVGGQPCRFKYRKVVPNSFGLTIDEILAADDKELNAWVSIKKAIALKPDHVELNEKRIFEMKARNEALKRKILPSLYKLETENNEESGDSRSKKKKKSFGKGNEVTADEAEYNEEYQDAPRSRKNKKSLSAANMDEAENPRVDEKQEDGSRSKKKKKSLSAANMDEAENPRVDEKQDDGSCSKKKKKSFSAANMDEAENSRVDEEQQKDGPLSKKKKKSLGAANMDEVENPIIDRERQDGSHSKKKNKPSGEEFVKSQSGKIVSPVKEENVKENERTFEDYEMPNKSPKKNKVGAIKGVPSSFGDNTISQVSPKKKKKNRGLDEPSENEKTETFEKENSDVNETHPQKLSKRQRKNLKKQISNNLEDSSGNNDKTQKVRKKRPAGALDESTDDNSSPVSGPTSKKTDHESETSQESKRRKLDIGITGKLDKNFSQNGKQSKVSNTNQNESLKNKEDKNRVLQYPISSKRKTRRGRERKKQHSLQKCGGKPRNVEAENKARAMRKQNKQSDAVLDAISDSRLKAYGLNPKKFKNKLKYT